MMAAIGRGEGRSGVRLTSLRIPLPAPIVQTAQGHMPVKTAG